MTTWFQFQKCPNVFISCGKKKPVETLDRVLIQSKRRVSPRTGKKLRYLSNKCLQLNDLLVHKIISLSRNSTLNWKIFHQNNCENFKTNWFQGSFCLQSLKYWFKLLFRRREIYLLEYSGLERAQELECEGSNEKGQIKALLKFELQSFIKNTRSYLILTQRSYCTDILKFIELPYFTRIFLFIIANALRLGI